MTKCASCVKCSTSLPQKKNCLFFCPTCKQTANIGAENKLFKSLKGGRTLYLSFQKERKEMKFKGITIGKKDDDKSKISDRAMEFMSASETEQKEMLHNSARGALESLARESALSITVAGTDGSFESLEKAEDFFIEKMAKHAVIFKRMSKEELTLEMLMRIIS